MIIRSYEMDFGFAGESLNMGGLVNLTFADDSNVTGTLSFSQTQEAPAAGYDISATLQGKLGPEITPTCRLQANGQTRSWSMDPPENDASPLNQEITITFSDEYKNGSLSGLDNMGTIVLDLVSTSNRV